MAFVVAEALEEAARMAEHADADAEFADANAALDATMEALREMVRRGCAHVHTQLC